MAAEHFLFAAPPLDSIPAINAQLPGLAAPPVRLLPTDLSPDAFAPLYPAPERVVIGQREEDLAPVAVDFADNPLLMVFGDAKSGKTTLLRHLIRTIRENSTPRPGGVHGDRPATATRRRAALPGQRVHAQYRPDPAGHAGAVGADRKAPSARGHDRRRSCSGWTLSAGHTHYLIVDDVDQIPDGPAVSGPYVGQRPWTALIGLLAQASDLGLRVIVTARAAGSAHAVMTAPLLRRLNDLQATTLMLSGNPQDSGKIRGHRFRRLPAGRGMLLDDGDTANASCNWSTRLPREAAVRDRGHRGEEYS